MKRPMTKNIVGKAATIIRKAAVTVGLILYTPNIFCSAGISAKTTPAATTDAT